MTKKVETKKEPEKFTFKEHVLKYQKHVERISKEFQELVNTLQIIEKRHNKTQLNLSNFCKEGVKLYKNIEYKIESFEESLLMIMHNIKKNQFLYSHYPEDWVKDYLSVKGGIKFENKFMDKKIEKFKEEKNGTE